jgi:hypothetical protein
LRLELAPKHLLCFEPVTKPIQTLPNAAIPPHPSKALYFLSSFFNQFGPNCTTWLVAAEVFPTDVRTTFQGASAAWGKIGAIIADIVFGIVRWGPGATY